MLSTWKKPRVASNRVKDMKAIAQNGTSFIIQIDGDLGRIVTLETHNVSELRNMHSFFKWGWWEEVTSKEDAEKAMKLIQEWSAKGRLPEQLPLIE
jgi:hypothetical protein